MLRTPASAASVQHCILSFFSGETSMVIWRRWFNNWKHLGRCWRIINKIICKKFDVSSFAVLVSTSSFSFQRYPSVVKWNLKVSKQIYENAIIPVIVQQSLPKPFVSNFSEHLNRSWVINLVFLPDSTKRWSSLLKCRILSETQVPRRLNTKGWGV